MGVLRRKPCVKSGKGKRASVGGGNQAAKRVSLVTLSCRLWRVCFEKGVLRQANCIVNGLRRAELVRMMERMYYGGLEKSLYAVEVKGPSYVRCFGSFKR